MQLLKPLALTLMTAFLSPVMAQVCNPDNPAGAQVGSCDNTDDGLCIVNGEQYTCTANVYMQGGGVCQTAVSRPFEDTLTGVRHS